METIEFTFDGTRVYITPIIQEPRVEIRNRTGEIIKIKINTHLDVCVCVTCNILYASLFRFYRCIQKKIKTKIQFPCKIMFIFVPWLHF